MSKKQDKIDKIGYDKFIKAAGDGDSVSMVLRCHLLAEYYLDHLIISILPRGDILLDQKFSFIQKVFIVDALNILSRETIDSIKALNSIRNHCSHDIDYKITESDIDKIGRPYGKKYTKNKREHVHDLDELLHWTLADPIINLEVAFDIESAKDSKN